MSAPAHEAAGPPSGHRAVENLIARYAELVDDGDFAGLGSLLADATFIASGPPVRGREAIERMFRDTLIVYSDGTPRTQHVTTNLAVEVDEQAGTAVSRSYVTVLQALPDLPLQPIACGRYHDRFERRDGHWRFVERRVRIRLSGDTSRHLRRAAGPDGGEEQRPRHGRQGTNPISG
ncbi:nuclear transport factor 2 family protein [Streptomyces sp. NPDC059788]|uniref:nuclear transport factor 2 family protein n=1 Tax=Streptomyces sp. NPDC059788 TaxID=3346948 RepID=UPI003664D8E3